MYEVTSETAAGRDAAWAALVGVSEWPRWTKSMTSVEPLEDGPLRVGSRVRIKQPGMPTMVWEVTVLRDGEEFTWASRSPGLRTVGSHRIVVDDHGTVRLVLGLEQTGPLAKLVWALTGARTRRFVDMEARGLAAASEARSAQ